MTVRLAVAAMLLAPSLVAATEVRLDPRGTIALSAGELVVRASEAETVYPLRPELVVETPPGEATLSCRGAGLWCPQIVVSGERVTLPVFATMKVTGTLGGPGARHPPAAGGVQGLVRGAPGEAALEYRTPLTVEGRRVSFQAPRAEQDLRFAFADAAPVYRWAVSPPELAASSPDATGGRGSTAIDLGELVLKPGGSLSGWAYRQEDDLPLAGAAVVAAPSTIDETPTSLRASRVATDERGFFQLAGLEPGVYRLEVTAPERVPRVLDMVEVRAAAETLIGKLQLTPPLQLEVRVSPPVHPDGTPWVIEVTPVERRADEAAAVATAGEDGVATVGPLRPAEHYVQVRDARGSSFLLDRREIFDDDRLAVELPVEAVSGTVRLGGEPIAATVRLEAGDGDGVEVESDEDGAIRGWMRRPRRRWLMATVDWSAGGESFRRLREVVPELGDDGVRIEVDLPAGTVYGDVVDDRGKPQRRLRVVATPDGGSSRFTEVEGETGDDGRFHLSGLESTRYWVQAGGGGWPASEAVAVDLEGVLPIGSVRLVVRPTRRLDVELTADGQTVAGAGVHLIAVGPSPVALQATTDARGLAVFNLPRTAERAVVTVAAPSRLLWSACVRLGEERLALALPALPSGALTLELGGRDDLPPLLSGRTVLVTAEGGFIDRDAFADWNRLRGADREYGREDGRAVEVLNLPGIAPGGYAATWSGATDWELAERSCTGAFGDLDWTTVPPGGGARLTLDSGPEQQRRLEELAGHRTPPRPD